MNLIPKWKEVATRSHSMWANYLGIAAITAPEAIYQFTGRDTDPRGWFWAGVVLLLYGCFGRLINQGVDDGTQKEAKSAAFPIIAGLIALLLLSACAPEEEVAVKEDPAPAAVVVDDFDKVAVAHIGKWEGLELEAYRDIVGVWTVCYGETKGVQPGDAYSKDECDRMLAARVQDFRDRIHAYFTAETLSSRLPVQRDVAYTSLSYNAGVGAISKSTAVRRINAGDVNGGCEAIGWWNKAGKRVVRGLVRRRTEEVAMCMQGAT